MSHARRPSHLKPHQARSLRIFQHNPGRLANFEKSRVLIWSQEHRAYWRRGANGRSAGGGYTADPMQAGICTIRAAFALTRHCGPEKEIWFEFVGLRNKSPVPGPENPPPAAAPGTWGGGEVMLNRAAHVLDVVGEEGSEVAQRVSKALRFGLGEVQPEQPLSNAERILEEVEDLIGAYGLAVQEGLLPPLNLDPAWVKQLIVRKAEKVERFLAISRFQGVLSE